MQRTNQKSSHTIHVGHRPLLSLTLQVSRSLLGILPPTFHSVTTTFPSFPHIEVPVPDPTPRSRTPRRDTDPLFPTLIPESHPPWVQQAGVTPVGAPGTTPLRPPGIAVDPTSDPFLSMDHRDIRDFNPIDPDIAKGKGKGKGKPADRGKGKGEKGR